jgi:phosphoesterase RecJ-like protein
MKNVFKKIERAIKSARTAIIAAHVDPDGDTIGSAIAMGMILEKLGVVPTIYSPDGVPNIYRFLPWTERVKNEIPYMVRFDLGFTMDASDITRVGEKFNLREVVSKTINIDHHPDNSLFGDINYVEKSSSVAEQVYKLCQYLKIKIDKKLAECLYTAMITDTGNFRYENTTISTFLIAADLLRAGVSTHEITTRIYDTKSIPSLRICARSLSQLEFSADHKVAWTAVTKKMMAEAGAKGEDLVGLVDQIRSLDGIEIAILFREEKGEVKVNFRSKHKINVSEIAKSFGGGGHIKAAGAIVKGDIESVKQRVIAKTVKHVQASKYLV